MKRADFIKSGAAFIGSTTILGNEIMAATKQNKEGDTFQLDYAPHQGMFSATAGKNFVDEIKYMHELGFRSIEDNGLPTRPVEEQTKIGETLAKLGMRSEEHTSELQSREN